MLLVKLCCFHTLILYLLRLGGAACVNLNVQTDHCSENLQTVAVAVLTTLLSCESSEYKQSRGNKKGHLQDDSYENV